MHKKIAINPENVNKALSTSEWLCPKYKKYYHIIIKCRFINKEYIIHLKDIFPGRFQGNMGE